MKRIILASASPRRKQLLEQIGVPFQIVRSDIEEEHIKSEDSHHKLAQRLSLGKARAVGKTHKNAIIIAADTIVVFQKRIIGKPKTEANASKILKLLCGKTHKVITGFTIIDSESRKSVTKSVETKVKMKALTDEEIKSYVKTKEPLDKAGGYGIQEKGAMLIESIKGDYFNVVGLPLAALSEELKKFGIRPFTQTLSGRAF
ncbi:septum formation inhibitor Maf [Candidatus Roizmanbacteria bacterium]|nr:septum formation inhibitor Maf [Candidatus Roizmanbacteria bacterium]